MGFTSHNDFVTQITAGKIRHYDGAKQTTPAHTAGGWHLLTGLAGNPVATSWPGTSLNWVACNENSGDGTNLIGIPHGGPPGGSATKHIVNVGASVVAAAGHPIQAKLVDLLGYYKLTGTDVTGVGSRTLANSSTFTVVAGTDIATYGATLDFISGTKVRLTTTTTLPAGLSTNTDYYVIRLSSTTCRFATSYANYVAGTYVDITDTGTGTHTITARVARYDNGAGVEACLVSTTAPTAGGPNLTASSYTNSAGTGSRAFQGSPTTGAAADAYAGRVLHSGNVAGRYGPFLPKESGDTGISSIQSFTLSAGVAYTGTGQLAFALVKPILDLPLSTTGQWAERDLMNQLPSLPKVEDGACLTWMLFGTGATTNLSPFTYTLDFAWGG